MIDLRPAWFGFLILLAASGGSSRAVAQEEVENPVQSPSDVVSDENAPPESPRTPETGASDAGGAPEEDGAEADSLPRGDDSGEAAPSSSDGGMGEGENQTPEPANEDVEPPPAADLPDTTETSVTPVASVTASAETAGEPEGDASFGGISLSELLDEEDELAVPEVIVRATVEEAFRTGGSVHILGEEQLQRFSYDDPHSVLLQVPGVYVRQEDGYGLRPNIGLRGTTSERSRKITLMEDGVLFAPATYSAPSAYYFPLILRMVGTEVSMGPAAIPYGPHTVGGAINFLNRAIPEEPSGAIDLAFGSNYSGRLRMHYGASNDWGGIMVEGVYLRSDGFRELDFSSRDGNTGFDRGEIIVRGDVHGSLGSNDFHRLEVRLGLGLEGSNESYLGLADMDFEQNPSRRYGASSLDRMEWWRTQAQVRYRLEVDDFQLTTVAYRNDFSRSWRKFEGVTGYDMMNVLLNPSTPTNQYAYSLLTGQDADPRTPLVLGTNARVFEMMGIQSDGEQSLTTGPVEHRVRFGLRFHYDSVVRNRSAEPYVIANDRIELLEDNAELTEVNRGSARALAAYLAWGLTWEGLTLTPGIRTEFIWTEFLTPGEAQKNNFQTLIAPGIGLQWEIIEEVALFAGVHRGYSPLAPQEPDEARPEESINYELGARFRHGDDSNGQLTLFLNDYSNLVGTCSFAGGCGDDMVGEQYNGGAAWIGGVEVVGAHKFRIDEVTIPIRGAYTFTYAVFRTAFLSSFAQFGDVSEGDRIPYVPEHQFSLQSGVEFDRFTLNVGATYIGAMWETAGQGEPNPAGNEALTDEYLTLDATMSFDISDDGQIFVRGENLTNNRAIVARRPFGARASRPLTLQVGFRHAI